jgi:hypothetical protein
MLHELFEAQLSQEWLIGLRNALHLGQRLIKTSLIGKPQFSHFRQLSFE